MRRAPWSCLALVLALSHCALGADPMDGGLDSSTPEDTSPRRDGRMAELATLDDVVTPPMDTVDSAIPDGGGSMDATTMGMEGGLRDGSSTEGGSEAGPCVPTGSMDLPDSANRDTNCDGIDGDASRGIFVSPTGSDSALGTRTAPLATLHAALTKAQSSSKTQIFMAAGTYTETDTLTLLEGIGIYGGYDPSAAWRRGTMETTVNGAALCAFAQNLHADTDLARVTLHAGNAVAPGASSIVLRAIDSEGLRLVDGTKLLAGNGADGSDGTAGTVGAMGGNGQVGRDGAVDNASSPGSGGPGGTNSACPMANGGAGGAGGHNSSFSGDRGVASALGVLGGRGGTTSGCTGQNGDTGLSSGSEGAPGENGSGGAELGTISTLDGSYVNASGNPGDTGGPGPGGGGGGGSSGQTGFPCLHGSGNGGGGGGAGGCGGTGGGGGLGGGASIALVTIRSPILLDRVTLTSGAGGRGGNGVVGADGGGGGSGAAGSSMGTSEIGTGGRGGEGARGGLGGAGGGGGGGPSIGLYTVGGAPDTTTATILTGSGGLGGRGPAIPPTNGATGKVAATIP